MKVYAVRSENETGALNSQGELLCLRLNWYALSPYFGKAPDRITASVLPSLSEQITSQTSLT